MAHYCGIDLHSNHHVVVVIDDEDKRVYEKRLRNELDSTLEALVPFRKTLQGVAVESTFNRYWLIDGLQEAGIVVKLVNTAAVKQYDGLKYSDDRHDAFRLAHLLRLGILPTGYIYPKTQRAVRDLLRRRLFLVPIRQQPVDQRPKPDLAFNRNSHCKYGTEKDDGSNSRPGGLHLSSDPSRPDRLPGYSAGDSAIGTIRIRCRPAQRRI